MICLSNTSYEIDLPHFLRYYTVQRNTLLVLFYIFFGRFSKLGSGGALIIAWINPLDIFRGIFVDKGVKINGAIYRETFWRLRWSRWPGRSTQTHLTRSSMNTSPESIKSGCETSFCTPGPQEVPHRFLFIQTIPYFYISLPFAFHPFLFTIYPIRVIPMGPLHSWTYFLEKNRRKMRKKEFFKVFSIFLTNEVRFSLQIMSVGSIRIKPCTSIIP